MTGAKRSPDQCGQLFLVATPIGNLSDVSARARQVLSDVALVAAEDTRHSGQLLQQLGISKPMLSLHEHNEAHRAGEVIDRLLKGDSVALVSDAGTPLISDPGYDLVRAAVAKGVRVVPVPGPCAVIATLSAAGLPTDRFAFEGFLPAKSVARRERLTSLSHDERTLVFYEAPHRLAETLDDMVVVCGADRPVVVARELTKQYETFYYGTAQSLASQATTDPDMRRGEIVIVVGGAAKQVSSMQADAEKILRTLLEELSPAQAAKLAAKLTGEKRGDLYDRAVALNAQRSQ